MLKVRKEDIIEPFISPTGEMIYEMIGIGEPLGNAIKHSVGHVVIPKGATNSLHYHPEAEETYYILKGKAKMVVDNKEFNLVAGDLLLIKQLEKHKIFQVGEDDLEFLVVCAPAWESNNSVYLE